MSPEYRRVQRSRLCSEKVALALAEAPERCVLLIWQQAPYDDGSETAVSETDILEQESHANQRFKIREM